MWLHRSLGGRPLVMALAVLGFFIAPAAHAVTYQYQSGPYDIFALGGYSSSDFVSGTFEIASPLAPNITLNIDLAPSITSFSFSDGLQTISDSTPGAFIQFFNGFQTDALGNITNWNVDVRVSTPNGDSSIYTSYTFPPFGLHGGCVSDVSFCGSEARGADDGGAWTLVPEPSLAGLALSALGLLGLRRAGAR